ncbi:RelA/SpoT domain-containing protein [Alkalispirochaeta sphaeroplastigenens]|uniref:RelA/SpoT domain-containing protein n=1 Tax=Alkalispirochaeta sphaeroplastigenens TaxID=1187066 RepID=UPI000CDA96A1|nr:RelA/SpoT domain-containing protein [Alkalispirochaeta sphaeroplastigenens]
MYCLTLPLPSRRELQYQYEHQSCALEKALHEMQRRIKVALTSAEISSPTLKYRIKSFDSFYEKLLRRSRESGPGEDVLITDLLGIRVVCPFVEELTVVEETLRAAFEITEVERKGAHLGETEFGYSSVHLLIELPRDIRDSFHLDRRWICEVQLRTILQDAWAEVEHELVYKAELTPLDTKLRRKLAALNANLTLSDIIFQEIRDYQRSMSRKLMRRRATFWSQLGELSGSKSASGNGSEGEDPIHTGSDTIDTMLIRALHFHSQKDYTSAIRVYTDILAYQPEPYVSAIIYTHRGMARFAVQDTIGAVEDFTATIRISPKTTKAYHYRGVVYRAQGKLEQALGDFSRCLEYDPYHVDSRIARAELYRELGECETALADCECALKLEPDNAAARDLLQEIQELQETRELSVSQGAPAQGEA